MEYVGPMCSGGRNNNVAPKKIYGAVECETRIIYRALGMGDIAIFSYDHDRAHDNRIIVVYNYCHMKRNN